MAEAAGRTVGTEQGGRLLSVNIGPAAYVTLRGKRVLSSIFKQPVAVADATFHGLVGDGRVERRSMGAEAHALSVYSAEHYAYWQNELQMPLTASQFGENLTLSGHVETEVRIGDVLQLGAVVAQVTQPREPCRKLDVRMGFRFRRRFLTSRRVGYYLRVITPGRLQPNDGVSVLETLPGSPSIDDFVRLVYFDYWDWRGLSELLAAPTLLPGWQEVIGGKLERAKKCEGWFGLRELTIRRVEQCGERLEAELCCARGRSLPPARPGQHLPISMGTEADQRLTSGHLTLLESSESTYRVVVPVARASSSPSADSPSTLVAGSSVMARAPRDA